MFRFKPYGQLTKTFDTSAEPLCFSPDGRSLAGTTWREGRVTIWDVSSGEQAGAWRAREGLANGVAFARDGRVPVAAAGMVPCALWYLGTQRQLTELRHEGTATELVCSSDGATLATTGRDDRLVKLSRSFARSRLRTSRGEPPRDLALQRHVKDYEDDLGARYGGSHQTALRESQVTLLQEHVLSFLKERLRKTTLRSAYENARASASRCRSTYVGPKRRTTHC